MKVCAIGLGRLGLPWALVAGEAGHQVVGVDADPSVVEAVNQRKVLTLEPGVAEMLGKPGCSLRATTSIADGLVDSDVSVVMVPTAYQSDGSFDLGAVLDVVNVIGLHSELTADPHLVLVVSTVSPGSISGTVRGTLERVTGRRLASRIGLAYSPEFHAIGSIVRDIRQPDLLIVGADDAWTGELASNLCRSLVALPVAIRKMSSTEAELTKLLLNCYVTTKISFANFVGELCEAYGANSWEVCDALGDDSRIGASYLRPGPPFGGPCFPSDNPALSASARAVGIEPYLPEAVLAVNERRYRQLHQELRRAGDGATVGVVGLEFKAGTGVIEGSPALELARRCLAEGRRVIIYDPLVMEKARTLGGVDVASSVAEVVVSSDVVLLANDDPTLSALVAEANRATTSPAIVIEPWSRHEP